MQPMNEGTPIAAGTNVVFREVWRDAPWSTWAVTVVHDGDGRTVLYRPIGTPGMAPVNDNGAYRRTETGQWFELRHWQARHVVSVHEWGQPFSIWCMWDEAWQHDGWYVNLERPWTRARGAIETMDHELDIVISPNRAWEWKDEDRLAEWVAGGAHTQAEADAFRLHGERVVAERIEPWASPFDEGWETWRPDPSWSLPQLPADWDVR